VGKIEDIPELRDGFIAVFDTKSKEDAVRLKPQPGSWTAIKVPLVQLLSHSRADGNVNVGFTEIRAWALRRSALAIFFGPAFKARRGRFQTGSAVFTVALCYYILINMLIC
jgi:hypothetical protein